MSIIDKILRAGEGRMLRKLDRLASQVDALQEDFEALTDEELQAKTQEFKDRLEEGETLDDIWWRRSRRCVRPRGESCACVPSTCRSWAVSPCTRARSRK